MKNLSSFTHLLSTKKIFWRLLGTKQLTVVDDFQKRKRILWKSMATFKFLFNYFCILKETFLLFSLYLVHRQWTRQGRAPTVIWWRVGPLQQPLMLYPDFALLTTLWTQQKVNPSPTPPVWPSPGMSLTVMEQKSSPTASQWATASSQLEM